LSWLRPDGQLLSPADWNDPVRHALGVHIARPGRAARPLLLLVNAGEDALAFTLPRGRWRPCLDSTAAGGAPADDAAMAGATCTMPARSVLLLQQED
jgi:glycogen operon protein